IFVASAYPQVSLGSSEPRAPQSETEKIKRALSAGPSSITNDATVAEIDSDGTMNILRQGTNDFTCMPDDPTGIGMPAMCADKVAMQWNSDFEHHKPQPSTAVPASNTCWLGRHSVVTPTRLIRRAHLSPLDHTG